MRISILSVLSAIVTSFALAVPHNVSVLHLPSNSALDLQLNTTTKLLGDWPSPPFTFDIGDTAVTIERYGRTAHPNFRPDIVEAIENLRKHFSIHSGFLGTRPIYIPSGIVEFTLNLSGRSRTKGEDVWAALLPIQLYYSDPGWSLHEILGAKITPPVSRHASAVRFSITFRPPQEWRM